MGQDWRDCIVTMIDMVGVKKHAQSGAGSALMRRFQALVARQTESLTSSVARVYVWNDSVLLLSYVDDTVASFESAMRNAEHLKRCIDTIASSYGIAVKGRAFPPAGNAQFRNSRLTVIEASSWAMANCFEIENALGRKQKSWYIDSRIVRKIRTLQSYENEKVNLLPDGRARQVCVFGGYLWDELEASGLGASR